MPYTYLIKCNVTGEFYYGVRYAKGCDPDELWKTYFTSSKVVKQRITQFGEESFSFQVRKVFESGIEAREWEHKVLVRIKAKERSDFLNLTDGVNFTSRPSHLLGKKMVHLTETDTYTYMFPHIADALTLKGLAVYEGPKRTEQQRKKISRALKGLPKDPIAVEKRAAARRGKKHGSLVERFGPERAAEMCLEKSMRLKGRSNQHKGKRYEEIYGIERAHEEKEKRCENFRNNNPSTLIKGKTYEEIYGPEKAADLKKIRSKSSKRVQTPEGVFESVTKAAEFYCISVPTMSTRMRSPAFDYVFLDSNSGSVDASG